MPSAFSESDRLRNFQMVDTLETKNMVLLNRKKVPRQLTAIGMSLLAGTVLFFILPSTPNSLLDSRWYLPLLIVPYAASALVVGGIWPDLGWRLGLAVFAVWGPMLQLMFFFSADQPIRDWKGEVLDLLGYFLILPGALIGAWFGSLVGRRLHPRKQVQAV